MNPLRSIITRVLPTEMSPYEAANPPPRCGRVPGAAPRDAKLDLLPGVRRELVRRSRYLHKNSGLVRKLVGNMAIYATGDGIKPQALSEVVPHDPDSAETQIQLTVSGSAGDSPRGHSIRAVETAPLSASPTPTKNDLGSRLAELEDLVAGLLRVRKSGEDEARRIAELEKTVQDLKSAMDGVSIEKASADRQALFAAAEGYLKADEYFEAGKYAIAGEGYLTFVQNNPGHADTRDVMMKARDSFLKAGYKETAFWVQDEMMKSFPQNGAEDMEQLAKLEKEAGLYDRAVDHMAQAAEMSSSPEERLWKRLYWAWYVQLKDGAPAGIAAIQQVQQEIAGSRVSNPKLIEKAAQHKRDWQLLLNAR